MDICVYIYTHILVLTTGMLHASVNQTECMHSRKYVYIYACMHLCACVCVHILMYTYTPRTNGLSSKFPLATAATVSATVTSP